MHFNEQPMSRKIIENGHEVSPSCTDKAIKKPSLFLHLCLYLIFWQLYQVIHSFVTSTVSNHALNLTCTELGLIVSFGLYKKNGVRPKLLWRLSHAARVTSKLTFCLFNSNLNNYCHKQINEGVKLYHIGDPLERLFADSTPVAPQSPMERFHRTSRRPYNEMVAMLVFQTNPVGLNSFLM